MVHYKKKSRNKNITTKKNKSPLSSSKSVPFLNNFIVALFFMILIFKLKDHNLGYKWVHEKLIDAQLKTIKKYKNLTFEEKQEAKIGFNGRYLNFVKNNTPSSAIILMPPDSIILPPKGKSEFNKYIKNKIWCSYFVYPRRIVYEREKNTSSLYDSITHIAIINGWGYDKLAYKVNNRNNYAIMPIKN